MIKAHKDGRKFAFDEPWNKEGRTPLLNHAEVDVAAEALAQNLGEKSKKKLLNAILVNKEKQNGCLPDPHKKFNDTTLRNYTALLASRSNHLSLAGRTNPKTNARWTAERSLIGSMTLLILVALTHFYVCDKEDDEWKQTLRQYTKEELMLYDMVCAFYGTKNVKCIKSHYVTCQDDTTNFICLGTQPERSSEVGLVSRASLQARGTLSLHHHEDSNKMNGMRVKKHCISNAAGDVAPICICISGLSEWEMPEDDFILWEIEGLCIGGYGVNGSRDVGYVLFMKKYKGAEKDRYAWIQKRILIPFCQKIRWKYDGYDDSTGAPPPEWMRINNYCDRDNSQLDTIVSEEGILAHGLHKITANKHSAARTGAEQAKDLDKQFIMGKQFNKRITLEHVPLSQHLLKRSIEEKFKEYYGKLRLKKKSALVDYLAKLPTIETRACVRENIVHGWVSNGMVDPRLFRMPSFHKIIGTIKRKVTPEEWKNCIDSFNPLMEYAYNNGRLRSIPDDVFIQLGFPPDVDANGSIVL